MIYQMKSFILKGSQPPDACLQLELRGRSRVLGLVTSMVAFDSAQLGTLTQPGPEGLQAEGGDVLVTGAVWLTEKLCEIICKSDLIFWQSGSSWGAVSDVK